MKRILPLGGGQGGGLLVCVLLLAGCAREEGRAPLTEANKAAEVQDASAPLSERIAKVQSNPNIPAPEKDRMVRILRAQAGQPVPR